MREIKFRAWVNGEMIPVGAIEFFDGGTVIINDEIPNSILMQYTGLNDKNRKEIYEGDVIESVASDGTKIRHVVEYDESEARFVCFHVRKHPEPYDVGMGITQKWVDEFKKEVIGNIYQNPVNRTVS